MVNLLLERIHPSASNDTSLFNYSGIYFTSRKANEEKRTATAVVIETIEKFFSRKCTRCSQ